MKPTESATGATYEMTLTRGDFLRLLPSAVGHEPYAEADGFLHQEPGRQWRIRLAPLPPLHLGPFPMERLRVDLSFEGYAPADIQQFLARFMAHFQRGGG